MARILVVGSQKNHDEAEFRQFCRNIGNALAQRGHSVVAAGNDDYDAETWVLDGANSGAKEKSCKVIPYAPAFAGTQNLLVSSNPERRWPKLQFQKPLKTKGDWAVGQPVALLRSDAALFIGGGILTGNVASLASELEKPFYAVAKLGGEAERIATFEEAKLRHMRMPSDLIDVAPGSPQCGERVVQAIEFVIARQVGTREIWKATFALLAEIALLAFFLIYLYHGNLLSNEPRLVLTTCLGAILGVILVYLVGATLRNEKISYPSVLRQLGLAILLGLLYGLFSFEVGSIYNAEIRTWHESQVEELANRMALIGIAVGALLGPASKLAIQSLRRIGELE